jgi:hypothetical protein
MRKLGLNVGVNVGRGDSGCIGPPTAPRPPPLPRHCHSFLTRAAPHHLADPSRLHLRRPRTHRRCCVCARMLHCRRRRWRVGAGKPTASGSGWRPCSMRRWTTLRRMRSCWRRAPPLCACMCGAATRSRCPTSASGERSACADPIEPVMPNTVLIFSILTCCESTSTMNAACAARRQGHAAQPARAVSPAIGTAAHQ